MRKTNALVFGITLLLIFNIFMASGLHDKKYKASKLIPAEEMPGAYYSDRVVVKPKSELNDSIQIINEYKDIGEYVLKIPNGKDARKYAKELEKTGLYEYVYLDYLVKPAKFVSPRESNDPFYSNQWHLGRIKASHIWNYDTNRDFTIAVVDTGVDIDHPDLVDNLLPGYNVVSGLSQADGGDVNDDFGHGTDAAGLIAAKGNNGIGVSGIGWNFKVVPVKVTNRSDGLAFFGDILQGIRWSADQGIKVITVDWESVDAPGVSTTGDYAREMGSIVTWSAGNSGRVLNRDPTNITIVGGTFLTDSLLGFSNRGDAIDLVAPGINLFTTKKGGTYGYSSGTSFSAPIVAGAISYIWSFDPYQTPEEVLEKLSLFADDLGISGKDNLYGYGIPNIQASVDQSLYKGYRTNVDAKTGAINGEDWNLDYSDDNYLAINSEEIDGVQKAGISVTNAFVIGWNYSSIHFESEGHSDANVLMKIRFLNQTEQIEDIFMTNLNSQDVRVLQSYIPNNDYFDSNGRLIMDIEFERQDGINEPFTVYLDDLNAYAK